MSSYVDQFLSTFMNGYRRGFSTQEALFPLIEIWKYTFDQNGYGVAILMDLWKAFDAINHDILIAKLVVYGFDAASLKINRNYLMNCFQRTKPNTNFSSWSLFNIYINDLFYVTDMADVCNHADDKTFHACDLDLKSLITRLKHDAALAYLFRCFVGDKLLQG